MNINMEHDIGHSPSSRERISYIKHMLGELIHVARAERAELLVYLLEMAFTEAGDLMADPENSTGGKIDRDKASGVPVKPAGKI
jgi:hypothetical protein